MKKQLLFFLALILSFGAYSQVQIAGTGDVQPTGNYAAMQYQFVSGATQYPADLTQRDNIATFLRVDGLLAYITSTKQTYQLQGGITNDKWVLVATGGSTDLSGYYTKTQVDSIEAVIVAGIPDVSGKANDADVIHKTGNEAKDGILTIRSAPTTGMNITGANLQFYNSSRSTVLQPSISAVTTGTATLQLPHENGTLALTSQIPTSANFVDLSSDQSVVGVKTFQSPTIFEEDITASGITATSLTVADGIGMTNSKITDLANGTDSNDAVNKSQLDLKANDNAVVKLEGNQTINGVKTFKDTLTINSDSHNTEITTSISGLKVGPKTGATPNTYSRIGITGFFANNNNGSYSFLNSGELRFSNGNEILQLLRPISLTGDRVVYLPDDSGTLALTSDLTSKANTDGSNITASSFRTALGMPSGGETLQSVMDRGNSTNALIRQNATDNSSRSYWGSFGGTTYLYVETNTPLRFGTNDAERLRISESGNVGIGTTSPAEKLEVNGNTKIDGKIILSSSTSAVNPGDIGFNGSVGSYLFGKSGSVNDFTLFNNAGTAVFEIINGTSNATFSNGNVAIGKRVATEKLEVAGNVIASTPTLSTHLTTKGYVDGNFAGLASPSFTGNPTAPTQSAGNNSTAVATTAYVDNAVSLSGASSGRYTPTWSGLTTTTVKSCHYIRIGNEVTVTGTVSGDIANGFNTIKLTLPVASNFTVDEDLSGVVQASSSSVGTPNVYADATNDLAVLSLFSAGIVSSVPINFTFTYQVK